MTISAQDRMASIQAGSLCALGGGLIACVGEVSKYTIIAHHAEDVSLSPLLSYQQSLESIIFAVVSVFLFGVTYRYIRRQDPNPHLRTGAIAAFGLTRCLAQLDMGVFVPGYIGLLLFQAGVSMLMFAVAAFGMDWALERGLIQRAS